MNAFDIKHSDFRRLDLNLLVAFDALLTERHVGQAAARLFIGQPAMSHALARLRELFDDVLFVRTGKRMEPTARALALAPRVRAWLTEGSDFLLGTDDFDPSRAEGLLRLSAPDGLEALLLPPLIAHLRQNAPGVKLRAQLWEVDQLLHALDTDEVDLVIATAGPELRDWHQQTELMRTGFHYLYSPRQLQLPRKPSLAQIAAVDHLASSQRGETASVVDHFFAAQGLQRRVVASSASLVAITQALRQAPLLSIMPSIYAQLLRHEPDIVLVPLDASARLSLPVNMLWHRRNERHPLQAYLREQIKAMAAALPSPSPRRAPGIRHGPGEHAQAGQGQQRAHPTR